MTSHNEITHFYKQLFTWDLISTSEAMNAFRTRSINQFVYSEALLHEDHKSLTLYFSGSEIQPTLALTFALDPADDNNNRQQEQVGSQL